MRTVYGRPYAPALTGFIGLLLLAALGVGVVVLLTPDVPPEDLRFGTRPHRNAAAGYEFLYPDGWRLEEEGTTTTLINPEGDIVISFGVGPAGDLMEASESFVETLRTAYEEVQLTGTETESIGGSRAIVVGGGGVIDRGQRVRFLAITVGAVPRNHVIGVFVPADADPETVLPSVRRVIGSFRPT